MSVAKHYEKNIFCIEGDWVFDLRSKSSVQSALQLLEVNLDIQTIYKTCSTKAEFYNRIHQILKAPKRYEKYHIIYLAFHGFQNGISINSKEKITLNEMSNEFKGMLEGKIIHFGSCSTLDIHEDEINNFISSTKALGVSGYEKDIDFISSTVVDVLYFEICQNYKPMKTIKKYMIKNYKELCEKLDFKIYY